MSHHLDRPKIMVLAPDLPYPIRAGGQMRMASFIQGMAAFAEVHVVCIAAEIPPECEEWIRRTGCTIAHYPRPPLGHLRLWKERAVMLMTRCNLIWRAPEQEFFDRQLREFAPDLVWLETPYLVRYAVNWRDELPVAVDYWGTSEGIRRQFEIASGVEKIRDWLSWLAANGGERRYAPLIANIAAVSKKDGAYFSELAPESNIRVIPSGIIKDPGHKINREERRFQDPHLLIMTGDLSYRPNIDAACRFVRDILPLIRSETPEVKFRLVGRDPVPEVLDLSVFPGVEVVGFVPDLSEAIAEAAVYVLPMRLGSGIRSKLFDVFPLGKPIVSTTIGAEGLELVDGENCYIADSEQDFARRCSYLLNEESERVRLGEEVRKLAEQVYSQENVERLLRETVAAILEGDKKHGGGE